MLQKMEVFKYEALPSSSSIVFPHKESPKRFRISIHNSKKLSESNVKKAKLSARKQERVKIPRHSIGGEPGETVKEFLRHPCGIEALLNTGSLESVQQLDTSTYRCTLPQLTLLNFEVSPVIDLRVTPTDDHCLLQMLSCKFEGSDAVKQQNERFSAEMTNYITWCTINSEPYLDIDVKLDLILEIYTKPFSLLPTSAVEVPGTLMMQALVDRLVPLLLQQLIQDYEKWVSNNPRSILVQPNSQYL